MNKEEIIKMLNNFPQIEVVKYIMNLQEQEAPHLFTDTNWEDLLEYNNTTWIGLERFKQEQQKHFKLESNWKALKEWLNTLPDENSNDLTKWQECVWDENGKTGIKKEVILNKMNELEGDK